MKGFKGPPRTPYIPGRGPIPNPSGKQTFTPHPRPDIARHGQWDTYFVDAYPRPFEHLTGLAFQATPTQGFESDSGIADFTYTRPFTNLFKSARGYESVSPADGHITAVDNNGWPTEDFDIILLSGVSGGDLKQPGNLPMTHYVQWDTTNSLATLFIGGPTSAFASQVSYTNGTMTWSFILQASDIGVGNGSVNLQFRSNGGAADYRNLRAWRDVIPTQPLPANQWWRPEVITQLQLGNGPIRSMNYVNMVQPGGIYGCMAKNWTPNGINIPPASSFGRSRPQDPCFTLPYPGGAYTPDLAWPYIDKPPYYALGGPWEYFLQLCNQTNRDPWIQIPPFASSDYLQNLFLLFKNGVDLPDGNTIQGLNSGLHIYFGIGNEDWNPTFCFVHDFNAWASSEIAIDTQMGRTLNFDRQWVRRTPNSGLTLTFASSGTTQTITRVGSGGLPFTGPQSQFLQVGDIITCRGASHDYNNFEQAVITAVTPNILTLNNGAFGAGTWGLPKTLLPPQRNFTLFNKVLDPDCTIYAIDGVLGGNAVPRVTVYLLQRAADAAAAVFGNDFSIRCRPIFEAQGYAQFSIGGAFDGINLLNSGIYPNQRAKDLIWGSSGAPYNTVWPIYLTRIPIGQAIRDAGGTLVTITSAGHPFQVDVAVRVGYADQVFGGAVGTPDPNFPLTASNGWFRITAITANTFTVAWTGPANATNAAEFTIGHNDGADGDSWDTEWQTAAAGSVTKNAGTIVTATFANGTLPASLVAGMKINCQTAGHRTFNGGTSQVASPFNDFTLLTITRSPDVITYDQLTQPGVDTSTQLFVYGRTSNQMLAGLFISALADYQDWNWTEHIAASYGEGLAPTCYEGGIDASGQAGVGVFAANAQNKRIAMLDDGAHPGPLSVRTLAKQYLDRHFQGGIRQFSWFTAGIGIANFQGLASWWALREDWTIPTAKESGIVDSVTQANGVGGLLNGVCTAGPTIPTAIDCRAAPPMMASSLNANFRERPVALNFLGIGDFNAIAGSNTGLSFIFNNSGPDGKYPVRVVLGRNATANVTTFLVTINGIVYGPFAIPNIPDPTGLITNNFDCGDVSIVDNLGNNPSLVPGTNGIRVFLGGLQLGVPPFNVSGARVCNIEIGAVATRAPYWAAPQTDLRTIALNHLGPNFVAATINEASAPGETAVSNNVSVTGRSSNTAIIPHANVTAVRNGTDGRAWQLGLTAAGTTAGICRVYWKASRTGGLLAPEFYSTVTVT